MEPRLRTLPPRRPDAHKGHFGRVQIIGGSPGMAGAPAMAALSALRSGAGLVQVVCPEEIRLAVFAIVPCATIGFRDQLKEFDPDVRAIGPGCGDTLSATDLMRLLEDTETPAVIDADGLNVLATVERWWDCVHDKVTLTPHPGEMRRLLQRTSLSESGLSRRELCVEVARLSGGTIVLKGHHTVVAKGEQVYVNNTGNAGMATGGSGDVLTGILAALIGQELSDFHAARLAVHIHGIAGDIAAREKGQVSMIATDIIDVLPQAFEACLG